MNVRPRVRIVGQGDRADTVRRWLLESGADPVTDDSEGVQVDAIVVAAAATSALPEGLPVLDATTGTRQQVAQFARRLAGRSSHAFDDHGSPEKWPRGSY